MTNFLFQFEILSFIFESGFRIPQITKMLHYLDNIFTKFRNPIIRSFVDNFPALTFEIDEKEINVKFY